MLKRAAFIIVNLLFLFTILVFLPRKALAAPVLPFTEDGDKMIEEFCRRRKGNQMNLETWYSGKCGGDVGERIGFGDIIWLDLVTKLPLALGGVNNVTGEISEARPETTFLAFGSVLDRIYTSRPVTTGRYLEYISQNLKNKNIAAPAYAQTGFGFQSLGPVLSLWRAFRDLAYLVFILAFVLYGFMIMFRMKINPQTVANIQSTIPKLGATLLIITFSFAIAGFIIDLTYLVQEVIVNAFFANINPALTTTVSILGFNIFTISSSNPVTNFILGLFGTSPEGVGRFIAGIFIGQHGGLFAPLVYILFAITVGGIIPRIMSVFTPSYGVEWVDGVLKAFTNAPLINLIVWLVLIIAIFYTFFKITFALIKAFTITIIQVVFAPLILLGDLLPGNDSFGDWWRTIVANMAVFPATIICFLLSFAFLGPLVFDPAEKFGNILSVMRFLGLRSYSELNLYGLADVTSNPLLLPPPLGFNTGINAGIRADAMMAFVGLGIFFMTPKLLEMLQEALKVKPFKYGTALAEALQFGWKPIQGGVVSPAAGLAKDISKRYVYEKVEQAAHPGGGGTGNWIAEQAEKSLQKRQWDK